MIDVWVADKAVQVEKSGPRSPTMDKKAKETNQTVAPFSAMPAAETQGTGRRKRKIGRHSSGTRGRSPLSPGNRHKGVVGMNSIPAELHLEILRHLDVPSILGMRGVNEYFYNLIEANQDTILRASLWNVECTGPHSMLLKLRPQRDDIYDLPFAQKIYHTKQTISKVAQICELTTNAKIDALYCIDQVCLRSVYLMLNGHIPDTSTTSLSSDMSTELLRWDVLGGYSTPQIQHMVSTSIRIIFKIAELMGHKFHGSTLHYDDYTRYNSYLVTNRPGMIVELEKRELSERLEYLNGLQRLEVIAWGGLPRMHDELIRFLETRGQGLMTEPGIEIQQFFREQDTLLDMRSAGN